MNSDTSMASFEKKSVSFHTLGCRLNFSESSTIAQGFIDRGWEVVEFGAPSDVTFLNTCTVTDGADSSCRNTIRKAQRFSPEGRIVVAGCYAQMEAEKIKQMQGVDLILGTSEKYKVFEYLEDEESEQTHIDKTNEFWGGATSLGDHHTRAFLKIQDGCNYVCSFCIIPFACGRSRTITVAQALEQAKQVVGNGFKEIVLTGVNIGEYESTSGERLTDLVAKILDLDGLERLRLSSVEPNTITHDLLDVLASSPKSMPHLHVPMQSGDDDILKSMRRKYDTTFYRDIMERIQSYFPGASVGADIIVGYPGESNEQFANTLKMVRELPLTHLHVFPYSKRKGTTAARSENHLQPEVKKARVKKLIELGDSKLAAFAKAQIGQEQPVLFERQVKPGLWIGHTPHFIKIQVSSDLDLKNQIRTVQVSKANNTELAGNLL